MSVVKCTTCGKVLRDGDPVYKVHTIQFLDPNFHRLEPTEVVVPACCKSCADITRKTNLLFWNEFKSKLDEIMKAADEQKFDQVTVEKYVV